MNWYHLTLSPEEVAAGAMEPLLEAFSTAFVAASGPRTMALFQRLLKDGGVELLVSPESADFAPSLLEEWNALPCERPVLIGLELLVGHAEVTYYLV